MNKNTNKNKPHPHAELIKAWADGAKIQYWNENRHEWCDDEDPLWHEGWKYRIKPEEPWEPKRGEKYFFVCQRNYGLFGVGEYHWNGGTEDRNLFEIGNCFRTEEEAESATDRVKAALKGDFAKDKMGWIKFDMDNPKTFPLPPNDEVLIYDRDSRRVDQVEVFLPNNNDKTSITFWQDEMQFDNEDITHWMPLPEPPIETD